MQYIFSYTLVVIYACEAERPPSWIFHFRLHLAGPPIVPLEWPSSKLEGSRWNFVSISSSNRVMPGWYFIRCIRVLHDFISNVRLNNRINIQG